MNPLPSTSGCFAQGWLLDLLLGQCHHLTFSVRKAALLPAGLSAFPGFPTILPPTVALF